MGCSTSITDSCEPRSERAAGGRSAFPETLFRGFPSASAAVECAIATQIAIAGHPWLEGVSPLVRIGIHTGRVVP